MNTNITILSQYFYPELISTGQVLTEIAEGLVSKGIHVDVICAQPSYYETKKVDSKMTYKGIGIKRVRSTQYNKNNFFGKIANSVSFFCVILVKLLFLSNQGPMLIVTNPPFLPFIGYIMSKLKKTSYIILIHDVYPDILYRLNYLKKTSVIIKVWDWVNTKVYQQANFIIVLGRDQRKLFKQKGVSEEKLVIIENSADTTLVHPIPKASNLFILENNLMNKFVVMYSGNMGLYHDMESIVEAAKLLTNHIDIVFILIGGGGKLKAVKEFVLQTTIQNVVFLPYQDKLNIQFTLSAADVALITLEKGMEGISVPCKLYGILAAGVPIVANVPEESEVAYVIKETNCGVRVPVKNPQAIANAILFYYNNPRVRTEHGYNAINSFKKNYTLTTAIEKYFALIQQLTP